MHFFCPFPISLSLVVTDTIPIIKNTFSTHHQHPEYGTLNIFTYNLVKEKTKKTFSVFPIPNKNNKMIIICIE